MWDPIKGIVSAPTCPMLAYNARKQSKFVILMPEVHVSDFLGGALSANRACPSGAECQIGVCVIVIVLAMSVSKTDAPTRR